MENNEIWQQCSDTATPYMNRTQSIDGQKAASSLFPKKDDLGIAKNYRCITLTSIAVKIYNTLLLNRNSENLKPTRNFEVRSLLNGVRNSL